MTSSHQLARKLLELEDRDILLYNSETSTIKLTNLEVAETVATLHGNEYPIILIRQTPTHNG